MTLNRRDFLGLVAGSAAGFGLSKVPLRRLVKLPRPSYRSVPGVERWKPTSCQLCPGHCGLDVRVVDGNPVSVRGNRLHPISRGGLCPVGTEAMHVLYSPDRIKAPLVRTGGQRGAGEWQRVDWGSALSRVTDRLAALRSAGRADRIFLLDGLGQGLMSDLSRRFLEGLGSPNYFVDRSSSSLEAAMHLTQGVSQPAAYDLESADLVLSFGVPLLEGWQSPVQGQRAVAGIRGSRAEGGTRRLIQFDLRASRTAHRADRFVQVQPGSYGALALSIAYVLIRKQLYDREFVAEHTFGFEDWTDEHGQAHEGFRTYVLREGRPQDLEDVTGVPSRVIVEIAQAFGEQRPALAIADNATMADSNAVPSAVAIHALNALVGSIARPGGSGFSDPVPFATWPNEAADPERPELPELPRMMELRPSPGEPFPCGRADTRALVRRARQASDRIGVLFLVHSNPFHGLPPGERFLDLLDEDSLVISCSPFPDTSTQYADLILPDHSFLERWQDATGPECFQNAVLGITRPVTAPLYDTRHTGDVLLELARGVIPNGAERFPWESFEAFLKYSAEGVFAARRGSVFTDQARAAEIREMERRGWWIPEVSNFETLWDKMLATGGWWDPAHYHELWGQVLRTPSRRFEFFSQNLYALIHADRPERQVAIERLRSLGLRTPGDGAFLPHHEPALWSGERSDHALLMHMTRPMVPNTAVAATLPWVRELASSRVAWETWAELHPEDATRLDINNGDLVRLSANEESFVARALVTESVQPGLVNVPYGVGREGGTRVARTRGSNPTVLIGIESEPFTGTINWQATRVTVRPAEEGVTHA